MCTLIALAGAAKSPETLEALFDEKVGLIINVGVGKTGQIKLEQRARNGTYEQLDVAGVFPPLGQVMPQRCVVACHFAAPRELCCCV